MTAGETAAFRCELSYEGIVVDWFLAGNKMEAGERVGPHGYYLSLFFPHSFCSCRPTPCQRCFHAPKLKIASSISDWPRRLPNMELQPPGGQKPFAQFAGL